VNKDFRSEVHKWDLIKKVRKKNQKTGVEKLFWGVCFEKYLEQRVSEKVKKMLTGYC
jgi:hypothetical protein